MFINFTHFISWHMYRNWCMDKVSSYSSFSKSQQCFNVCCRELNKKLEGELTADAQHGKLKQQIVMVGVRI